MLILCATTFVRIRLLQLPLERDEGEYAYAGQLMLEGIPPYKLAYNMKLPGTYAMYALVMAAFGETTGGIHLGLIIVNNVTVVLLYFLGRRLFGPICGVVTASSFAFLSLSNSVLGLAGHATHFVTLFAVAGTLVALKASESNKLLTFFSCGLLFGLAFLMKQPGIFFCLFGAVFLFWMELKRRPINRPSSIQRLSAFCVGATLPLAVTCLLLAAVGVFGRFWFWTFSYAGEYVTNQSLLNGYIAFESIFSQIFRAAPGIWLLALLGMASALFVPVDRRSACFALGFLAASFATACPGLYFRQHYFVPLLAAAGLFAGLIIQRVCDGIDRAGCRTVWLTIPIAAFVVASGQLMFHHRALFFQLSPNDAARAIYGANPFPESVEIAQYIQQNSVPDSRIAVIGSEPQIYFYSRRHSATGYIYTYPLMTSHRSALAMQREMIAEILNAQPNFLVFVNVSTSWLSRRDSPRLLLEWADQYARTQFQPVGLVEIRSMQPTVYNWAERAVRTIPSSQNYLWIFKRKNAS